MSASEFTFSSPLSLKRLDQCKGDAGFTFSRPAIFERLPGPRKLSRRCAEG